MASPWYIDLSLSGSSGSGTIGDPYSWDQFITNEAGDLTSLNAGEHLVYLKNRKTISADLILDDDADGWVLDAGDYLHYTAWPGFEGTDTDSDNWPGWDISSSWVEVTVENPNTRISKLGFSANASVSNPTPLYVASGGVYRISECIVRQKTPGVRFTLNVQGTVGDGVYNCLMIGDSVAAGSYKDVDFWHCGIVGVPTGKNAWAISANGTRHIYNTYVYDIADTEWDTNTDDHEACAGEDAGPANDTSYTTITSDPFTDYTNGDYTLAAGADILDKGVHPGSGLTTDLIGNPRTVGAFPDCGPIEWQSAAVGFKPLLQRSTVGNKLYDGTIL